jgi:hypothetical protein
MYREAVVIFREMRSYFGFAYPKPFSSVVSLSRKKHDMEIEVEGGLPDQCSGAYDSTHTDRSDHPHEPWVV